MISEPEGGGGHKLRTKRDHKGGKQGAAKAANSTSLDELRKSREELERKCGDIAAELIALTKEYESTLARRREESSRAGKEHDESRKLTEEIESLRRQIEAAGTAQGRDVSLQELNRKVNAERVSLANVQKNLQETRGKIEKAKENQSRDEW